MHMMDKSRRKSQRTKMLRGKLSLGQTRSDDTGCVYHCANVIVDVEIFSIEKKTFSDYQCPC